MRRIWNDPKYRPLQVAICAVLILFLIVALYISWGCPTLSMRQEFRRAEKAHLVGPSKIVDTVSDYSEFEKMIVGETEYGICFFGRYEVHYGNNQKKDAYRFTYREKTGDLTVAAAPNLGGTWMIMGYSLPVYLFDEYPEAVRAELEVTVSGQVEYYKHDHNTQESTKVTENYTVTLQGSAKRTDEGFFCFIMKSETEAEARALSVLSNIACGDTRQRDERAKIIPATVRLFDAQGNLILEREIEITA